MDTTVSKSVFITGINGFVGEHVARAFRDAGYEVNGIGHDDQPYEKVAELLDHYVGCNLLSETDVNDKLSLSDTSAIIHLAGLSNVSESFKQPQRYVAENGVMTHNLLAKAAADGMSGRVITVSTGALYDSHQPLPLSEEATTSPSSPYAVGKLMTESITHYHRSRGLDAVVVRPFNHIGPGQGPGFIIPDLYDSLKEAQTTGKVTVGNLKTQRDYTDVRDIVKAYYGLATAEDLQHDTYNICSGRSLSGEDILHALQEAMGIHEVAIKVDQSRLRPNDIMDIYGNASRLREETGWRPTIDIKQTVADYVDSREQS